MKNRNISFEKIQGNIEDFGYHIYLVLGGASPRFAYTIGLSPTIGAELVFAGASFYFIEDVNQIVKQTVDEIKARDSLDKFFIEIEKLGQFTLNNIDDTWTKILVLGALDFYNVDLISCLQILPDRTHWTIDVPNLSKPWSAASEPVWKWIKKEWEYSIPEQSMAVTNLDALQGNPITEVVRWEENEWELFAGAGPDVREEDIRKVPLGTLLAWDKTLEPAINLTVKDGLWREPAESKWQIWQKK